MHIATPWSIVLVVAAVALAGCGSGEVADSSGANADAPTGAPTLQDQQGGHPNMAASDCPAPPTLSAPPTRVVTMDGGAAAILDRLGVGDRIVGTASPDFFADFPEADRARFRAIPVVDPGTGNAEAVIAARPDLVVGVSIYEFGVFAGNPSIERLRQASASVLVACDIAGDGHASGLEATFEFIRQAAAVFGVPERAEPLVAQIRTEAQQGIAPYAGRPPVRTLSLSSPPAQGQPISTHGGSSQASALITLAGGQNVAGDVNQDFARINGEELARRDPQAIVVVTGFRGGTPDQIISGIKANPLLAATTAVRENRFVIVAQTILLSPSVLSGQAVATIAAGIHRPAA